MPVLPLVVLTTTRGVAQHFVGFLHLTKTFGAEAVYAAFDGIGVAFGPQFRCLDAIARDGWSHALLRRIVLIRENLPKGQEDDRIEELVQCANLNAVAVSAVVHSYSQDQSILTIKRSILNIADRGAVNRYSRMIARLSVQPFAKSQEDLSAFLSEVEKCSLIDAIILAKFNAHLFDIEDYPAITDVAKSLGQPALFDQLAATFDDDDKESEYTFFKQCSAWLEYEPVRQYRILLDLSLIHI